MGGKTCDVSLNFVSSSTASPNVPCGAPALASDAWSHPGASNAKFMDPVAVGTSNAIDPFAITDRLARPESITSPADRSAGVGTPELDLVERAARRHERTIDLLPREFRLLKYMMQHSDHLLKRRLFLRRSRT
jgi:hypothetical protein